MVRRVFLDRRHAFSGGLRADAGGRNGDRDFSSASLYGSLYGSVLCDRLAGHAALAAVEAGRQTCGSGDGAADCDGVRSAGRRAGLCAAARHGALRNGPEQLEFHLVRSASIWGGAGARSRPVWSGFPESNWSSSAMSQDHNPFDEWVYNAADIDGSKVVWAREMDAADNLEIVHYYGDRKVWLVEPDAIPARIEPYEDAGQRTVAGVRPTETELSGQTRRRDRSRS